MSRHRIGTLIAIFVGAISFAPSAFGLTQDSDDPWKQPAKTVLPIHNLKGAWAGKIVGAKFGRLLVIRDVPDAITSIIVEAPEPTGPFGAKGVGEPSLAGIPGAIANAIAAATGVRLKKLPFTPERVLQALQGRST